MKIKKIVNKIWKEFIFGGHLQCLGMVAIVYISTIITNLDINITIIAIVYLISYPIYVHDRLKGIQLDKLTNPERTEHYNSYLYFMPKIIILSVASLIILLIFINNLILFAFSSLLIILGLLYPIFFKNVTKKIIAFKNFFVSIFFASTALIPVLFYESFELISEISFLILVFLVFIKTILMQIFLDTKDIESDRLIGLLTIPVLIGKEKSLQILKLFTFLIPIMMIPFLFIPNFQKLILILVILIPLNLLGYHLAKKENYTGYILGSAEFSTWLIFIPMNYLLW